jgi:hypothetical protein
MDVFHHMNLALVLRQRKPARTISQTPLPGVVVNRKPDKFDKRWTRTTLRFVFVVRSRWNPESGQVELGKCGNAQR